MNLSQKQLIQPTFKILEQQMKLTLQVSYLLAMFCHNMASSSAVTWTGVLHWTLQSSFDTFLHPVMTCYFISTKVLLATQHFLQQMISFLFALAYFQRQAQNLSCQISAQGNDLVKVACSGL